MDNKTAFTQVRAVLTHYRAFQHIEDILSASVTAEAQAGDLEKRIAAGKTELDALAKQSKAAKARADKAEKDAAQALGDCDEVVAKAKADAMKVIDIAKAETKSEVSDIRKASTVARKAHDEMVARFGDEIAGLEQAKSELEGALEGLKARVAQV